MPYYFFIWTPDIIEHLAEHDITTDDFEYVVSNPQSEGISRSSGNTVAFGFIPDGRYICCVFSRFGQDTIQPITAYEVQY